MSLAANKLDSTAYAPRAQQGTRERLLGAAIELTSERGLHAVSLREITQAAGARNASAIRYHFGNRHGLIEAMVHCIAAEMVPAIAAALDRCNRALAAGESVTARDVVEATFAPAFAFTLSSSLGLAGVRILPRVLQDRDYRIRSHFEIEFGEVMAMSVATLEHVLDGVPASVIRLRMGFAMIGLLNMVTDLHVLYGAERAITDREVLVPVYDHFLDYVAAGLAAPRGHTPAFRRRMQRAVAAG